MSDPQPTIIPTPTPDQAEYLKRIVDTTGKFDPNVMIRGNDPSKTTADAAHDKAYREGWMQAFREWSDCLRVSFPAIVSQADIDRMERRKQEMESYDKHI